MDPIGWAVQGQYFDGQTSARYDVQVQESSDLQGLVLFVILPLLSDSLATILPRKAEIAFGNSVVQKIERFLTGFSGEKLHCTDPAGLAARDRQKNL